MTIEYDGTDFYGWQVQKKGRTVQGVIEGALTKFIKNQKITLIGSGRTDSGVHAFGQVANIKLDTTMNENEIMKALEENSIINGFIKNRVKGGFTVLIGQINAFLPGSLVDVRPVRDTQYLEGTNSEFKVIKADERRIFTLEVIKIN